MLRSDLAFLPERMKINKCTKLTCTIQNKENYVIQSFKASNKSRIKVKKGP